jgi:GH18 family chitinase
MRQRAFAFVVLFLAGTSPAFAYRMCSWMPLYASGGLESTQLNASRLTESNPVWYEFRSDGTIVPMAGAEDATWRAAMTGTEILPTVQNLVNGGFDKNVAVQVLSTAATREAHAESIFQIVMTRGYDGIDIDYEKLPYASRANFVAFLQVLAGKLHGAGKKLSVTVYAKTSDSPTWDGAGGHDYSGIGQVADFVKLMVYPYSYSGTPAGPLSPLDWLDQVVGYAESAMPASKVVVGLPWYGKDWAGTSASSTTYPKAMNLAAANSATIGRDANGEATFTYSNHTVFFNDAYSYDRKADLVMQRHPNVAGFAHWANGQEDPAVWTRVGALKTQTGPVPTPVPTVSGNILVSSGAIWRYLDNGTEQGTVWNAVTFDDSTWRSGAAQLGYGDYDEATKVSYGPSSSDKYITTYFRYGFDLADAAAFSALKLRLLRDDGAVVYLNGTEVFRSNMPTGAIGYRTLAAGDAPDESTFLETVIDARLLVSGRNLVAVEIHQSNVSSSDISFNLELTGTVPPVAAPGNLSAAAVSSTRIDLAWTDNSTTESGFRVERCIGTVAACDASPSSYAQVVQLGSDVTSYADMALASSTNYSYRVRAYDANGTSSYSNSAAATTMAPPPPAAPSGLVAAATTHSQINVSWADNSSDESGFLLEQCTGAIVTCESSAAWSQIAQTGTNVTSYNNGGLASSTTYTYRVRSFNAGGNSAYSISAAATTLAPPPPPLPPSSLRANAVSVSQVSLVWSDNSADENGFRVDRCAGEAAACDGSTAWTQIVQTAASVTSYSDITVAASSTYTYRVTAFNAWGSSASSNTASVTTPAPPPPPIGPQTFVSTGSVWKYLDNGSDQGSGWTATGFDDATWLSGAAQLGYGEGDEKTVVRYGPDSNNKFVTTYFRQSVDVVNPSAFQSLKLRLLRDDGAVVYLNGTEVVRSNMPAGLIGYRTYASTTTGDEATFLEFGIDPLKLVPGRNTVAVEVHQAEGNSSDVSFDLELIGSDAMAAPSNLTASAPSTTTMNLTWTDTSFSEDGFRIERCTGSTCSNFAVIATVGPNVTSFSDTGLQRSTYYRYRVSALTGGTSSAYSNVATARTRK